jgi:hypothetical protein
MSMDWMTRAKQGARKEWRGNRIGLFELSLTLYLEADYSTARIDLPVFFPRLSRLPSPARFVRHAYNSSFSLFPSSCFPATSSPFSSSASYLLHTCIHPLLFFFIRVIRGSLPRAGQKKALDAGTSPTPKAHMRERFLILRSVSR